jgi:hypothetical protein
MTNNDIEVVSWSYPFFLAFAIASLIYGTATSVFFMYYFAKKSMDGATGPFDIRRVWAAVFDKHSELNKRSPILLTLSTTVPMYLLVVRAFFKTAAGVKDVGEFADCYKEHFINIVGWWCVFYFFLARAFRTYCRIYISTAEKGGVFNRSYAGNSLVSQNHLHSSFALSTQNQASDSNVSDDGFNTAKKMFSNILGIRENINFSFMKKAIKSEIPVVIAFTIPLLVLVAIQLGLGYTLGWYTVQHTVENSNCYFGPHYVMMLTYIAISIFALLPFAAYKLWKLKDAYHLT